MRTLTVALALCTLGPIAGQEAEPENKRPSHAAKLKQALEANAALTSVRFDTIHQKLNDAGMGQIRINGAVRSSKGRPVKTRGTWDAELLSQELGDEEAVVFHGRRMIAKDGDRDWTPRRGHRADGQPLGFVLDPRTFFAALAEMPFEVVHNSVGEIGGRPVMTCTARLKGEAANALLWTGAIPDGTQSTPEANGMPNAFTFVGGGMLGNARADRTVELAISFDPATRRIYRVHGRSVAKGRGGGRIAQRVLVGGFGVNNGQEEEEADEEKPEPAAGSFQKGLSYIPKEKVKKLTVVEFTYDFRDHGQATVAGLDGRARRLLGLPGGK